MKYDVEGKGEIEIEGRVEIECLCGKLVRIGNANRGPGGQVDVPVVLHQLPVCADFNKLDALEFVTWLRKMKEN